MIAGLDGSIIIGLAAVCAAVGGTLVAALISKNTRAAITITKERTSKVEGALDIHTAAIIEVTKTAGQFDQLLRTVESMQKSLSVAAANMDACEQRAAVLAEKVDENRQEIAALRRVVAIDHPDLATPP